MKTEDIHLDPIDPMAGSRLTINATTKGDYDGAELKPYQGRPGANDALGLPSRISDRLHYRDGRIEPV